MNSKIESAVSEGFVRLPLPPAGFIDANGPLYGKWELDRIVLGVRIERRHCNTNGTCHGGMLALLADMLLAMGSNLQADLSRFLPTVNLTCDFLGPATLGSWIEGRLEVLRVTNSLVFSQGLLTVQGDLYKGKVGQQVGIGSYSPPAQLNVDGIEDVSGGNLLGRWRRELGNTSDLQVQAYYDRTYRLGPQVGETRNTFDLDLIHHFVFQQRNEIVWGLGARWSPSDIIQTVPTVNFSPHHQNDNIYSAFVQDQIAIVQNKLWLTLGSKFEHNIFTGWENEPSGRVLWTPTSHQTLWAAGTRAVRTPSRIDEDLQLTGFVSTPPPIYVCVCDNAKFVSETLLGYEAGYRKLVSSRFYVDIAAFHNKYNDLTSFGDPTISLTTTPPPLAILVSLPFANGIMGSTSGGEISPEWKATRWMEMKATYSYVTLNLQDKPTHTKTSYVSMYEGSSPHNEATAQILFNLPKGFEFDPTYRYVGALPALGVNAYHTADARLGWHFAKKFDLSITGQNLFQPRHAESGPVLVQRSVYAQITWRRAAD